VFELTLRRRIHGEHHSELRLPCWRSYPEAGVVLDTAGNVYGTRNSEEPEQEHIACSTAERFSSSCLKRRWTENVLVNFDVTNGYNRKPTQSSMLPATSMAQLA